MPSINTFLKTLGPGILFASTAIGVSHLVQSTRAGAEYGFTLIWAVVLANLFKYPFFEYGSRYANVKKKSILDGYKSMGSWMLILYLLITIGTMFFVSAAVCGVTSGFMENLFGLEKILGSNSGLIANSVLICFGILILILGKYKVLDSVVKIIGAVLLISTLLAFVLTIYKGPIQFNFGYLTSAFLSICFVTLGCFMIFGSGETMSKSGALFANKVVSIFSGAIGEWSYFIIAAASFSIMLGTFIAVLDGYGRALAKTSSLLYARPTKFSIYNFAIILTAVGAF